MTAIKRYREHVLKLFVLTFLVIIGVGCRQESAPIPESFRYQVLEAANPVMGGSGVLISEIREVVPGHGVCMLADGNHNTYYTATKPSFSLTWSGDKSSTVTEYILVASPNPDTFPSDWQLLGSDDGTIWITLDVQKGQKLKQGESGSYHFPNANPYKYYRLQFISTDQSGTKEIAEWQLGSTKVTSIEDLMPLSSGSSHSDMTPMGNHYEGKHVTTSEDRAWLLDPNNEPNLLGSAPNLRWNSVKVDNVYPFGTPLPADVNQHAIGDCSALAVFAALAYAYPDFIKSIIRDNKDHTYLVKMYDPQGAPIEVSVSDKFLTNSNGDIQAATGKNSQVSWATILEKAVMKFNAVYGVNPDIGGIGSEHVAPLFTGDGDSFAFAPGVLTPLQMQRVVDVCLRKGLIVVGGFNRGDVPVGKYRTVTGHAYTFSRPTDSRYLFDMRNPWGTSPGSPDGKEDGVVPIPDNPDIISMIDLRIMNPGAAKGYHRKALTPYLPPLF